MSSFLKKYTKIESLVLFRICFGLILLLLTVRTLVYGWVDKFYIQPKFLFKFYPFVQVEPMDSLGMYLLFIALVIAAICITIGLFYTWAVTFFLFGFVYTEFLDVTHYLNHYYLVSLLLFLALFLPANRAYAVDVWRNPKLKADLVPKWTVDIIKLQLAIVYIYAGIAKLHADWLLNAQPMQIWLNQRTDFPILGVWFGEAWVAYFFSWFGMIYDLSIVFFLMWKPTRFFAYLTVILFHLLTALLFNIGIFPYLMILSTLIFLSNKVHTKIISIFATVSNFTLSKLKQQKIIFEFQDFKLKTTRWILVLFFGIQFLFPLRHYLYPGDVHWTEEGFRFSWKVMIIDKKGTIQFRVVDPVNKQESWVNHLDYLSEKQAFMMSTQADLIIQFAHFLGEEYRTQHGYQEVQVFVDSYVSLNGRISQRFIDPDIDLMKEQWNLLPKEWIVPFE
ncbi:MAG: HTTM domain-containing protein [Saprospiraceae bacterium]|nr:HTTM domain-containing protein [Saprospiraceae bacterium]